VKFRKKFKNLAKLKHRKGINHFFLISCKFYFPKNKNLGARTELSHQVPMVARKPGELASVTREFPP